MKCDAEIGSDEMVRRDLPDVMEWLWKRVQKRKGSHPPEMVFLALLAAECWMVLLSEDWPYNEPAAESFEVLKVRAKELAVELMGESDEGLRGEVEKHS